MAVDENNINNGKKSKFGQGTSTSEPNLNSSSFGVKKIGFPPGITVDELWLYRRKKAANCLLQDNIKLPDGSFKLLKSEYKKKYKDYYSSTDLSKDDIPPHSLRPKSALKLEGSYEFHPEYYESYIQYPSYESTTKIVKPSSTFEIIDWSKMDDNANVESLNPTSINKKPKTSSLQNEGDFEYLTEHAEKFIEYLLNDRRPLLKKPTSLKLEGVMEKKTETAEQFQPYELEKRPPLCKKFTNLHLEGDLDIVTEKQEKFKPYQVPERPVIRKKSTNLHLEGALTLSPEYRSEYVNHKNVERTKLVLPTNNLKPDGSYENIPEIQSPFVHTLHPVIPHLRESVNSPCPSRPCSRPPSGMDRERRGTLQTQLSRSHQNLFSSDTRMDFINKNAYIDSDDRCKTPVKTRRALQQEQITRPKTPSRDFVSTYFSERAHQQPRELNELFSSDGELDYMPIKNGHLNNAPKHKSELCIREPELNSADGRFICQPEYRRAYVDYLIRERIDRKPRTIDFLNQHKMRVFDDSIMDKQFTTTTTTSSDNVPTTCKNQPSSASSTSLPLPPKTEKPKMKYRSYSQIEEEAFGPRLPIPIRRTSSSSRSSSPSCRRRGTSGNNNSCHSNGSMESDVPQNKYKKFAGPVKVENIACKQSARSALPPARSKWMRDDSTQSESAAAFYILDDKTDKHRSFTDGNLNKLDKWSPKWHKHGK